MIIKAKITFYEFVVGDRWDYNLGKLVTRYSSQKQVAWEASNPLVSFGKGQTLPILKALREAIQEIGYYHSGPIPIK